MRAVRRYPFNVFRWVAAFGLMLALAGAVPAEEVLPGNALSPSPSQPATPDQWMLRTLDGPDLSFSQFKGKVIVLHFWATWCGPCLQEMPTLEKLYQKVKGQDIVVLVVANQDPSLIRSFISQSQFTFPKYTCGLPPAAFWWTSLPATFVIDREGKVVKRFMDPYPFDGDAFIGELQSLNKRPVMDTLKNKISAWVIGS